MNRLWLVLLIVGSCSTSAAEGNTFELVEGSIAGPDTVMAGVDSSVRVINHGEFGHTFVITDSEGRVINATEVLEPGASVHLDLNLIEGAYLVSCRLITQSPDGTINDHFQLGMYKTIRAEN